MDGLSYPPHMYPTLHAFARDKSLIKMVLGPAGSSKTTFIASDIIRMAALQEPSSDGIRYSHLTVLRNTYNQLKKSTIQTFLRALPRSEFKVYGINGTQPPHGELFFRLPDGTKVFTKINFLAMDDGKDLSDLLGYETSWFFFDEVSEFPLQVITAAATRVGRFKSPVDFTPTTTPQILGAMNGPTTEHWSYKWAKAMHLDEYDGSDETTKEFVERKTEIFRATGRNFFALYNQPPALLRPTGAQTEWRPNPEAENVHNLPNGYAYYYNMLTGDDRIVRAFVEGKFAPLAKGELVFPQFSLEKNVIAEDYRGAAGGVFLAFDFGRTPVCLAAMFNDYGQLVIVEEFTGSDVSIDTLLRSKISPTLMTQYPFAKIMEAFGDPAGEVEGQAVDISPFDIIRNSGIVISAPTRSNRLQGRLDAVREMLTRTVEGGRPALVVSSRCKFLVRSLGINYIYEYKRSADGEAKELPTKTHEEWASDLADALQYLCLGVLRSVREPSKSSAPKQRNWRIV